MALLNTLVSSTGNLTGLATNLILGQTTNQKIDVTKLSKSGKIPPAPKPIDVQALSQSGDSGANAKPFLTLGGIGFRVQELPEKIPLGGKHVLAVREFPGGGLDIQALGAFDNPISWQGTLFQGNDAFQRALQIDAMRIAGTPITLDFSTVALKVLITQFKYDYFNDYYVEYEIELQPDTSYDLTAVATVNGVPQGQTGQTSSAVGNTTASTTTTTSTTTSTTTQSTTSPAQPQPQKTYNVVAGDTLWALAMKYYGDPTKWPIIAAANAVQDPKLLQIGTNLAIPNPSTASAS